VVPLAAATHKPTEFFREWAVRTQNLERVKTSGMAFKVYCKTVPLAFQPLDDSNGTVTYAEVVEKIKEFRALFTASGFTVLTDLHCAFVGIATEQIWMDSTRAVGGSGRTYDQSLSAEMTGWCGLRA